MAGTGRLVRTKGGTKFKRKKKVWKGRHDWNKFPEVSVNSDLFFESPHPQIIENIIVKCVRVKDGDTIQVKWSERKFLFPVRFAEVFTPELNTWEGRRARDWLRKQIEGREVELIINPANRIGKWGRILAIVMHEGTNLSQALIDEGFGITPQEQEELSE